MHADRRAPGVSAVADFSGRYGTALFFITLIVLNAFITPNFVSLGTVANTLVQVFPVMLVALGMTMVISSGGIDISVGAIMAVATAVAARLYTSDMGFIPQLGLFPAICCGLVAGGLCGLFNGLLVAKFRIQPIIVTLVTMIAGRALAHIILDKLTTSLSNTPFGELGKLKPGGVPIQIVMMTVVVAVMVFVARKTNFAKRVEAVGDNPRAARLVGINTVSVLIGVYILCGVLCAVAGMMEAARSNIVNVGILGKLVELDAIAAVAIGGTAFSGGRARIMGTVFGAIVVQLVTIIVNMNNIDFHYSLILKAIILIIAVWTQRKT